MMEINWSTIIDILQGLAIVSIPAYFALRGKQSEVTRAKVESQDDILRATTELQVQLSDTARSMIAPLKQTIEEQSERIREQEKSLLEAKRRIAVQDAELEQMRTAARMQAENLVMLREEHEAKITALEEKYKREMTGLKSRLTREKNRREELEDRIRKIRVGLKDGLDIDTGKLSQILPDDTAEGGEE